MPSTLRVDRDGRVMTVRFDNPPQNFMTREMVAELIELTDSLEGDASIGSVVLTGANPGLFITHYDVAEILAGSEAMDRRSAPASPDATLRAVGGLSRVPGGSAVVGRIAGARRRRAARGPRPLPAHRPDGQGLHRRDQRPGARRRLRDLARLRPALHGRRGRGIGLPEMSLGFNPGAGGRSVWRAWSVPAGRSR